MRWDDFRRSDNIEDRREEGGFSAGPGGGMGIPVGRGGLGIGTIIVLGLVGWALGIDPRLLIGGAEILSGGANQAPYQAPSSQQTRKTGAPTDQAGQFVAAVLGDTEDRWSEIFSAAGARYRAPILVIYRNATPSPCVPTGASSAMGPFYCPLDHKLYLDTSFFRDMQTKFQSCDPGSRGCEFAQAYVIAHEVGHHVQNLLGVLDKVQQQKRTVDERTANALQVRVELQADCLAGVWAHAAQAKWNFLESGDVEAAMRAAASVGDDRLQQRSRGYVVPDAFTHGSSAQRVRWFTTGFKEGTVASCNTFRASQL